VPDEVRCRNVGSHVPLKLSAFLKCQLCSTREDEKWSSFQWSLCMVSLCVVSCFSMFHTRKA